jgi:hypothetical protein
MALVFLGKQHEDRFLEALKKANATRGSENRRVQAVIYLLSAVPMIERNMDNVFDYHGGFIKPDAEKHLRLSTGERIIFALALNLFNGYVLQGVPTNPHQAMGMIDSEHKRVYLSALEYCFI